MISQRSTSFADQPARSSTFVMESTGAVVNHSGACAWVDMATMRASAFAPFLSAVEARMATSAAAPSEIAEALPAVTVPSFSKAARSDGILPESMRPGFSSSATVTAPLRPCTSNGAISF